MVVAGFWAAGASIADGFVQRNARIIEALRSRYDVLAIALANPSAFVIDHGTRFDLPLRTYEYLMQMYASEAGKSGGEYYTPQEVSELLARITVVGKTEVNKVYDPAVGSGSLLLKFQKVLGPDKVRQGYFGQVSLGSNCHACELLVAPCAVSRSGRHFGGSPWDRKIASQEMRSRPPATGAGRCVTNPRHNRCRGRTQHVETVVLADRRSSPVHHRHL